MVSLMLLQAAPTTNETATIVSILIGILAASSPAIIKMIHAEAERRQEDMRSLKALNEAFENSLKRYEQDRAEMSAEIEVLRVESRKARELAEKTKREAEIERASFQKQLTELTQQLEVVRRDLEIVTLERDELRAALDKINNKAG